MIGKYRKAKRVNMPVGEIIRNAREMLEMSQGDLAKKTGILPSHLSGIEAGKRRIGCDVAERIGAALNLSPSYVLFSGKSQRAGALTDGTEKHEKGSQVPRRQKLRLARHR